MRICSALPKKRHVSFGFKTLVYKEYARRRYLLESKALFSEEKKLFENFLYKAAGIADYENSLQFLSELLHRHHEIPAVILVDEDDSHILRTRLRRFGLPNPAIRLL